MATKYPPPSPPFIRARNQGGSQTPKALVIHGTVSSDNAGTARNIALWWNGPTSPMSSCHYVVDPKEAIQCVGDHSIAYHCGYNTGSIGIELCDEQTGPASRWQDADSKAILARAARLAAELCLAYNIDPVRPTTAQLKAKGPHGIYGHNDSRLAFGRTTHTDPRDFDWANFLGLVRAEINAIKGAALAKPKPAKKFKVLHAPLHGASATRKDIKAALGRKDVVGIVFTEAYRRSVFLATRGKWRAVMGGSRKDANGRMVERDVILMSRRYRKHHDSGILLASNESTPLKIAPERHIAWSVSNVDGRKLATIGVHCHAATKNAWGSDRAAEYRRSMKVLRDLVRDLRKEHGSDLDIVILGDFNYPDNDDDRFWTPGALFDRLGLDWVNKGVDWVAFSSGLKKESKSIIGESTNGQDHPWIEVEFSRK